MGNQARCQLRALGSTSYCNAETQYGLAVIRTRCKMRSLTEKCRCVNDSDEARGCSKRSFRRMRTSQSRWSFIFFFSNERTCEPGLESQIDKRFRLLPFPYSERYMSTAGASGIRG